MSVLQTTFLGTQKTSVIAYHEDDLLIKNCIEVIQFLSLKGQISEILILEIGEAGESAFHISNGLQSGINLDHAIAGLQNITRVDIIGVCSSDLSKVSQQSLSKAIRSKYQNLEISAPPNCVVNDHRLYFPWYREFGSPSDFLTGQADSRLVVIPEDRQNDFAFGTGVSRESGESAFWHLAIEIISAGGYWVTLQGSILERVTQTAVAVGTLGSQIQIIRSFVRSASSPLNAFFEEFETSAELPAPVGSVAAPDPYYLAQVASEKIHSEDFKLRQKNDYEGFQVQIDSSSFLKKLVNRIIADLKALRKTLSKGYSSNIKNVVDEFTQGLIGDNSWLTCLPEPLEGGTGQVTQAEIDDAIEELERTSTIRHETHWDGEDGWGSVLQQTFGVVDGNDSATTIRQEAGNNKWVALDRTALITTEGGEQENLQDAINNLSNVNEAGADARLGLLQLISKKFRDETTRSKQRCENLLKELRSLKPEDQSRSSEEVSKMVTRTFYSALFIMVLAFFVLPNFMHAIFDFHENWRSETKFRWFWFLSFIPSLSFVLILSPSASKQRQNLLLSFFAIYAVFGLAAWDPWDIVNTAAVPVLVLPFIIALIFGLAYGGKSLLKTLAVNKDVDRQNLSDDLSQLDEEENNSARAEEIDTSEEGDGDLEFEMQKSELSEVVADTEWNQIGQRLFRVVRTPYLLILLILALNDSNNLRKGIIQENNHSLFWVIFLFAFVMFFVSFLIIDIIRSRDETRLADWKKRYIWQVEETRFEFQNYKIIENFEIQWLGTASVITRIFNHPYGKKSRNESMPVSKGLEETQLQKLRSNSLELTDSGRKQFEKKSRLELASPGWLTNVYELMKRKYLESESTNVSDAGDLTFPESCPYPVTLEEAIDGSAKGRRWPFCYKVYAGEFDSHIRATTEKKLNEILLKTFLEDPESYRVDASGIGSQLDSNMSLANEFSKILPTGNSVWVPAVFGSAKEINYQTPDDVESFIWWPEAVELPHGAEKHAKDLISTDNYTSNDGMMVQAVRVDISQVLLLNDFFKEGDSGLSGVVDTGHVDQEETDW